MLILALAGTCAAMSVEIRDIPFDTGSTDALNIRGLSETSEPFSLVQIISTVIS
jgi:hypothetical protein